MMGEEKISVLRRYLRNPFFDDSDLYYNGLCNSTEFLDHKPDISYKFAAACSVLLSQRKNPEISEREPVTKGPPLFRSMIKPLAFPNPKTKKRSTRKIVDPTLKPAALIETHKSPSYTNITKQAELLPSTKESPGEGLRLTFKLIGNTVWSVQRSHNPSQKKRPRDNDEDDCTRTKKRVKNQEFQAPVMESTVPEKSKTRLQNKDLDLVIKKNLTEDEGNIPAKLKTHLQNNDAVLVIKKDLTRTDVNPIQIRLSIPISQLTNHNFLNEDELRKLTHGEKVEARLIDPSGAECDIKMAKWKSGNSMTYNLLSPWNKVVAVNNLQIDTPIELYSFREGPQLYFALIKLQPYKVL